MKKFVLKRFLISLVMLWVIITITFLLMHTIPSDPFAKDGRMPETVYNSLHVRYGLDRPLSGQYITYLKNVCKLDLGESMKSKTENVNQMIARGAPVSGQLGTQAFVISIILGPALGSIAALYQNKFPDYLMMVLAIIGISVPSFVLGTLFIQLIASKVSFLPIAEQGTWAHTILPSIALSFMPTASSARIMRSSMLEVLGQDYIRTVKSEGPSKFRVIMGYAVRNAILPIVSQMGATISGLLTRSFVIEKISGVPGLGNFFVTSIINRDYALIMGTTIFYLVILILILLIVDTLYAVVDPRIKLGGESS